MILNACAIALRRWEPRCEAPKRVANRAVHHEYRHAGMLHRAIIHGGNAVTS
ncbi:hypothetical protein [Paraburkholderia lycopersici]|uniref:hypothetical protein n=1 Tax=Paraburkholderia lycopersici TaxID=416944 RepID=UPI0015A2591A|nr:hypothetical protein [Paraburkholderia lycopersici]